MQTRLQAPPHGRKSVLVALGLLVLLVGALARPEPGHADFNLLTKTSSGDRNNFSDNVTFAGASLDGSRVLFYTADSTTIPGELDDDAIDTYVRSGGTVTNLTPSPDDAVLEDMQSRVAIGLALSEDGSRLFYRTTERHVPDENDGINDIYMRANGVTSLITPNTPGAVELAGISPDGTKAYFLTSSSHSADDTDTATDVYLWDEGSFELVSDTGGAGVDPNAQVTNASVSPDGSHVFFHTTEALDAGDTDGEQDVYQWFDGEVSPISEAGDTGGCPATFAGSSVDGTHVFFTTIEAITLGINDDIDFSTDVYERFGDATTLVSAGESLDYGFEELPATFAGASADGTRVFFHTDERMVTSDTDDNGTDSARDVYERANGITTNRSEGPDVGLFMDATFAASSPDGSRVWFNTPEAITDDDEDGGFDVYEDHDGVKTLVSVSTINSNQSADYRGKSADGSRIYYITAEPLVPADTDASTDIYERSGGVTTLVSDDGTPGDDGDFDVEFEFVTPDGSRVFFTTPEPMPGMGDTDSKMDLYAQTLSTVAFDATASGGAENVAPAVTVELNAPQFAAVTVDYAVTGGTATAPDFSLSAGTLTFAEGETSKALPLTLTNDAFDEPDETIVVTLSSPANASLGLTTVHTFTIQDEDPPPAFAFTAAASSVSESAANAAIPVELSAALPVAASVDYAVTGGSATPGVDFTLAAGTLPFPAGTTSVSIPAAILGDITDEPDKTVVVTLSSPTNAVLGAQVVHSLTIQDDDPTPVIAFGSAAASSVVEDAVTVGVPVELSVALTTATSVNYAVTGGTATQGSDYTLVSGTLSLPAGSTSASIAVAINEDFLVEPDETITLGLSDATGANLGVTLSHTLTITNDDAGICRGRTATIVGTSAAQTIAGTSGDDVIVGGGGNDVINAGGGNDVICAGAGNDTVNASGGNDTVYGEGGDDKLRGGAGNDRLFGLGGKDIVDGGGGNDTIEGGAASDTLRGGGGKDAIRGGGGNDTILGGGDDDTLRGDGGSDTLKGQSGKDGFAGGAGAGDRCEGGPGVDALLPNAGCEVVVGVP